MASLNIASAVIARNAQNQSVPNAKRYIYNTGTDTLSAIYKDPDLTRTVPNPVIADETGMFRNFYVMEGNYDVVTQSPTGEELNRLDDLLIQSPLLMGPESSFKTLPDLLADTMMDYDTVARGHRVQVDDLVEVTENGFSYQIAAVDAVDHHLTTAGGIKLYVLPESHNATSSVWNLAAFNVDLTGETDESDMVQKIMDLASGGGTVYHPGGVVKCVDVDGRTGIKLTGTGSGSVFVRGDADGTTTGNNMFSWATGQSQDVTVSHLAFDLRTDSTLNGADLNQGSSGDFKNALKFDDFSESSGALDLETTISRRNNVRVTDCVFFNSNQASAGNWTLTAVTARGINDLMVSRNNCRGVQIKLAGSGVSSHRIICTDNVMHDSFAYAISAVVKEGVGNATRYLGDVSIQNNIAYGNGPRSPAYYTGADDGAGSNVICRNVLITNNQAHILWDNSTEANFAFVKHRGGTLKQCSNVRICGNNFSSDNAPPQANSAGIVTSGDGIIISNNSIDARLDKAAIRVGSETRVMGNTIRGNNRGIEFVITEDCEIVACNNILDGQGVHAPRISFNGSSLDVQVRFMGNTFIDPLVDSNDYQTQPFSLSSDGGTVRGSISNNTVLDMGNTDRSVDENDQGGSTFDVVYANNHFGTVAPFRRRRSGLENLFGNTGMQLSHGPLYGEVEFTSDVTFRSHLRIKEGATEPAAEAGNASLFVDSSDGLLKIKFGNGTVNTVTTS